MLGTTMHIRLVSLSLLASCAVLPGQAVWSQVSGSGPGNRYSHAMAFDAAHGVTVMYGGSASLSDTWLFDGSSWSRASLTGAPGPRRYASMCYHIGLGQVLMVGGQDSTGSYVMDTWGWNGVSWQMVVNAGSLPQGKQSLAYDPIRNVVVEFDGLHTYEWNGAGIWQQRTTAQAPATGYCGAMAYDPAAGRVVLYTYGQTWTYDGTNWTRAMPANSPPARDLTAMAYDSGQGQAVLFGGYSSSLLDDTWVWNGNDWSQQIAANPPPARYATALAYDPIRQRVVMYGGWLNLSDTWLKNPTFGTPATLSPFGTGCAGSAGTPVLGSFGGTLPWIGSNLVVQLRSLPVLIFRAPFGILGLSRTN
jgi:hypothetical protein